MRLRAFGSRPGGRSLSGEAARPAGFPQSWPAPPCSGGRVRYLLDLQLHVGLLAAQQLHRKAGLRQQHRVTVSAAFRAVLGAVRPGHGSYRDPPRHPQTPQAAGETGRPPEAPSRGERRRPGPGRAQPPTHGGRAGQSPRHAARGCRPGSKGRDALKSSAARNCARARGRKGRGLPVWSLYLYRSFMSYSRSGKRRFLSLGFPQSDTFNLSRVINISSKAKALQWLCR